MTRISKIFMPLLSKGGKRNEICKIRIGGKNVCGVRIVRKWIGDHIQDPFKQESFSDIAIDINGLKKINSEDVIFLECLIYPLWKK